MGPSAVQIERVAATLAHRLIESQVLEPTVAEEAIRSRFTALLKRHFEEEAEIARAAAAEAERLVRQGAPGVRREELDLRRVEQLVKQRIARERGFPL